MIRLVLGLSLLMAIGQENPAVDHAKRVLDLLEHDRFEEVAKEFNAPMAAALTAAQLGQAWASVHQQAGAFSATIDQQVRTQPDGITAVVLGCRFEKMVGNLLVAFDAADKIAGLRITPRPGAAPAVPDQPSSSDRFTEEAVTVGTGEWILPGTLTMPKGPIAAAIVLVHGSGPGDRDETVGANKPFRDLAWGLGDRGIAVLRFDKRTNRYADKFAPNQQFTVREETIDDAVAAVALLRSHDRIDPKRVFVLGHSLGGTLAPRIAAADPAIAGLVIMAGATRPLLDAARDQLTYLASLTPGATVPEGALDALKRRAPDSYWKDLDAYHPSQAAAQLTLPILILQGERDYQVTAVDLKGWRDALDGRSNVAIKTYPTLNHLFMPGEGKSTPAEYQRAGHVPEFVFDDIAAWMKRN